MKPFNHPIALLTFLAAVVGCSLTAFAQKSGADAVLGVWKTGNGRAHIEIFKQNNRYFGKIIWMDKPNDAEGKPRVDKNNPEEKLRTRPIMGLVNMRDFVYEGDRKWEDGKIYDPQKGKDYSCEMTLVDAGTLDVRGYIGITLIGRTDTWKRVK